MIITALMENTAARPDLAAEHGLSLYIQTGSRRILFDMGQSGAFADNALKLGVDLSAVDLAILSHGHYDHGGGVLRFFAENDHAPLYVSPLAFEPHYNAENRYIGLDPAIRSIDRLVLTTSDLSLGEGLTLRRLDPQANAHPSFGKGLTVLRGGEPMPDDFLHEQYLEIIENGRRVLISGCSHRGVLNIAQAFRPDVLVGGLHLMKLSVDDPLFAQTANALRGAAITYYTCHCTGREQYDSLRRTMGVQLHYLAAGDTITL